MKYILCAVGFVFFSGNACSQVARYSDINNIGWLVMNFDVRLNDKLDIVSDHQIRRDEWGLKSQQYLHRAGLNYRVNKKVSLLAGYAFIQTFPYGDMNYPVSSSRVNFPENRIFQQLTVKDQVGAMELTHRYRLEQRWVASQIREYSHDINEWKMSNRFRYMLRFQMPFRGVVTETKSWYFAGYNELFLSFGRHVGFNVFDQNRSALLIGYKAGKVFRLEAGPFAQILQLGALRNVPGLAPDKTIVQYNLGYTVNVYFNFDAGKKAP